MQTISLEMILKVVFSLYEGKRAEQLFSPYEFFSFGGGVRRCIGEALALYEMKLVVATILTHYRLDLADSKPEHPQRRGVTLAPAGGVKMVMQGKG